MQLFQEAIETGLRKSNLLISKSELPHKNKSIYNYGNLYADITILNLTRGEARKITFKMTVVRMLKIC